MDVKGHEEEVILGTAATEEGTFLAQYIFFSNSTSNTTQC